MDPNYLFLIILMWMVMTFLMAAMGYNTFDQAEKLRHRREYYGHSEAELSTLEKRDRKEGAWTFILSPLAPFVLLGLVVFGAGYLVYFTIKFFFTVFPEMIRALR